MAAFALLGSLLVFVGWYAWHRSTKLHPDVRSIAGSSLHSLLTTALGGALTAGKEIVQLRKQVVAGAAAAKGAEPVTVADERSNGILASQPYGAGIGLVTEEGVSAGTVPVLRTAGDTVIFIDPLDATQEYTEDLTQYVSVQMCVTQCGRVLGSLLHFPFTGRTMVYRRGAENMPGGPVTVSSSGEDAVAALLADTDAAARTMSHIMACPCVVAGSIGGADGSGGGAVLRPGSAPASGSDAEAAAATALKASVDAALARAGALTDAERYAALRAALPASIADNGGVLRVVVTRSHLRDEVRSETGSLSLRSAIELLSAALPNMRLTRAGGAGYKLAGVLTGEFDAYIHDGPIRQWDVCAGGAMVAGAGGAVSDWTGEEHNFCVPPPESGSVISAGAAGSASGARAAAEVAADAAGDAAAARSLSSKGSKSSKKGKASFAVRGILAARDAETHGFLLRVIRGEFGGPPAADAAAAAASTEAAK